MDRGHSGVTEGDVIPGWQLEWSRGQWVHILGDEESSNVRTGWQGEEKVKKNFFPPFLSCPLPWKLQVPFILFAIEYAV